MTSDSRYRCFGFAVAFDPAGGILYLVERRADEEKSVIHAFKLTE